MRGQQVLEIRGNSDCLDAGKCGFADGRIPGGVNGDDLLDRRGLSFAKLEPQFLTNEAWLVENTAVFFYRPPNGTDSNPGGLMDVDPRLRRFDFHTDRMIVVLTADRIY